MQNGLMVLHSNRLETLTSLVADWLAQHPLSPLESDVFLVQSNGMAQWLRLQLAEQLGISASQHFHMPARFLWSAYRTVLGEEAVPRTSPFDKSRLLWRLYQLLPSLLADEHFRALRQFLQDDTDARKRHQLAERLADLFDAYQVYRADWLNDWEQGNDQLRLEHNQHSAIPLPEGQGWQPHLWRALLADMSEAQRALSRSRIHERFLHALKDQPTPAGLPKRLIIFGISALPQQALEALAALSEHCQILMLVQNPCQHYWADIVEDKHLLRQQLRNRKRHLSALPENRINPLLAAWGKQGRDFIGLLYDHDDPESYRHVFQNSIDLFEPHDAPAPTRLQDIQHDILDLASLPHKDQRPHFDADQSLHFTTAYSPLREVEILHDTLLEKFRCDANLQPRDIIVMVPDIDVYAPYINAVFGRIEPQDPRYLPYTLSDRNATATSPMANAVNSLLHLPQSRFTAASIFALLEVPALRRRFSIQESDLLQLNRWIEQAGIRWGLHAEQRRSLDLPGFEQNSWAFGLKRMLAGYLMGNSEPWQGIEPLDEVAGLNAALAGQLDALLTTLETHWRALQTPADAATWQIRFATLLSDFFQPHSDEEENLDASLRDALNDWLNACQDAQCHVSLPISVARRPLLDALNNESLSQRFLAGRINFCTLMPMRAIPFRHVCLLGMKDGDYPRQQQSMDFDLMQLWGQAANDSSNDASHDQSNNTLSKSHIARYHTARPGDRSRRDDDRYLFLEALLSARESLYISWAGHSPNDNSERPPSVLVAQLRDYLNQRWQTSQEHTDHRTPAEQLTQQHPLQPFSLRYFEDHTGEEHNSEDHNSKEKNHPLISYANEWRSLHAEQGNTSQNNPAPLAPMPTDEPLTCAAFGRFLKQPVNHFFEYRLKTQLRVDINTTDDSEPFELDGLTRYQLQEQLLDNAIIAGEHHHNSALEHTLHRFTGSGLLPLAPFSQHQQAQLTAPLSPMLQRYFQLLAQAGEPLPPMEIQCHAGDVQVEDWLTHLRGNQHAQQHLILHTGKLQDRQDKLTHAWVQHLVGCVCGLSLTTHIQGQDGTATLAPLSRAEAQAHLDSLAHAWQHALQHPLPIACATAFAWLGQHKLGKDEDACYAAAEHEYEGGFQRNGEKEKHPALARAWPTFNEIKHAQGDNPQRGFEYWLEQLYTPLFEHVEWHAVEDNA